MPKHQNIYQSARERAGLTQEAAAERMGCAPETIRAYESDRRRPADEIVCLMAEVYNDLSLGYLHLKTGTFAPLLPDLDERSLQECTMRLFRLLRRFVREERADRLMEIAEDGVIDERERPIYDTIMDELKEIVETVVSMMFCPEESGRKNAPQRTAIR